MNTAGLFDLAFRQNNWLAARQSAVAANVANANTPGYRTRDVAPFDAVVSQTMAMAGTSPMHFSAAAVSARPVRTEASGGDRVHSGNDVNVEREFLKSGEVMRGYAMNAQVIKSFHRMLMLSAKV